MLSPGRVKELLRYDPDTGVFVWLVSGHGVRAGDRAGTITKQGYVQLSIDGVRYRANRIAWLVMTGEWPGGIVDHRDGVRANNRWRNLRDTTHLVNMQNRTGPNCGSSTGLLGVTRSRGKFQAQIQANGRDVFLGRHESPEEAHAAYLDAKRRLHEGCTI